MSRASGSIRLTSISWPPRAVHVAVVERQHDGGGRRLGDATPSARKNGGRVGGPSGWPVTCANPLIASAKVPKPGRSLLGPPNAVPADMQHDHPGMRRVHRLVVEPPLRQGTRPVVRHENVADVEEAVEQVLALGAAQVERDAPFVAAHALPEQADAVLLLAPGAQRVAHVGLFDLDHLGAELAEHGGDHRPGRQGRRVDDPDAPEREVGLRHPGPPPGVRAPDVRAASCRS